MSGGYVVTVKRQRPVAVDAGADILSRQEVDTLDDVRGPSGDWINGARTLVHRAVIEAFGGEGRDDADRAETEALYQAAVLPESGDSIGPLPDGSTITVERKDGEG